MTSTAEMRRAPAGMRGQICFVSSRLRGQSAGAGAEMFAVGEPHHHVVGVLAKSGAWA